MTPEQLSILLEVVPQPAFVCDGTGAVVARNRAAVEARWDNPAAVSPEVEIQHLGDGWCLARRLASIETGPQSQSRPVDANSYPGDIDTLARGIVHEIRNPLAAILTGVKLIQDDPQVAEETAMLLGVIRKESLRINDILSAFSEYVRPRAPRLAFFDLTEAVRAVVAQLLRDKVLSSAVMIEDTLEVALTVWGDEAHFRDALCHILKNAADAMPYDELVRLSAQRLDRRVLLHIDDNGPGFSPESLQRAFQPFYSTKPQSIGLGLCLAQSTLKASGGSLQIENLFDAPSNSPSPDPATAANPTQDKTPLNGTGPRPYGARACIELPIAPSEA